MLTVCYFFLYEGDDDNSELTELRQAQEALFPLIEGEGPKSVISSEISSEISFENRSTDPQFLSKSSSTTSTAPMLNTTPVLRNKELSSSNRSRDLSSLDIVQEEQSNYHSPAEKLPPVDENGSAGDIKENNRGSLDLSELEDLPSSAKNDPFKKSSRKADDDSVSYSDIDDPAHVAPPNIKMCFNVRNSMIEREFATEELTDVEFGETKQNDDFDEHMTLEDLLEGPTGHDNSFRRIPDDSQRSDHGTFRTTSSKSRYHVPHHLKRSMVAQTAKLDTKAAKKLRRKNKRLW